MNATKVDAVVRQYQRNRAKNGRTAALRDALPQLGYTSDEVERILAVAGA